MRDFVLPSSLHWPPQSARPHGRYCVRGPRLLRTTAPPTAQACGRVLPKTGLTLVNLGRARVVQELRQRLDQVGRLRTPVLLIGEAGCGFELCARHLHLPNTPWVAPEETEWLANNPF